jgi:dipeptidyl aminopeptidase/acylaminoacyl peptidase
VRRSGDDVDPRIASVEVPDRDHDARDGEIPARERDDLSGKRLAIAVGHLREPSYHVPARTGMARRRSVRAPMQRLAYILAAFFALGAAAIARPMQPDDVFKIVSAAEPAFSPDGKTVVFIERHVDVHADRSSGELELVDVGTGAKRALTHERRGLGEPQFSPDGALLTFIAADAKHHGQVYALPLAGGDAVAITATHAGVQQYAWRPDGAALAYVTQDENPQRKAIAAHRDLFDLANDDYKTESTEPPSHVWLVSKTGGNAHRLTAGTWSLVEVYPPSPPASPLSWSPDGKSLLFTRVPTTRDGDAYESQIVRLDIATGRITPLTSHTKFEGYAAYSPDGSKIAYLYSRDGDPNNENEVMLADAAGGAGIDLSRALDRAIFRAQWFPDGKSLLVGSHDGTRTALYRLKLDGTSERLDLGDTNPAWFFWIDTAIDPAGAIVYPGSQMHRPTELWYAGTGGSAPRRLTDLNAATAALDLGRVDTISWQNDGFDEDGVLTYPPGFTPGKQYPLVLEVHGGPQAASVASFNQTAQLFAAHGYVVFEPNYRGSDNLGNAYERAIFMDAGAGPGRDVMAGVAAVKQLGFVDTSRIAVGGWSYGGFMTSWLMAHYHIWKTAISGAAVNNWVDMYNLGDANVQIAFSFKGSPYVGTNMRDYVAQSPITYAAQTTCPVLIISDTGDVRVPVSQSFAMYRSLRDNHIPVRFVGIPVSGHYPGDPVRRSEIDRLWLHWLDDHLK